MTATWQTRDKPHSQAESKANTYTPSLQEGDKKMKIRMYSIWTKIKDLAYQYRGIFAWFMTMRERQILATWMKSKKEIGGNHALFFRDN